MNANFERNFLNPTFLQAATSLRNGNYYHVQLCGGAQAGASMKNNSQMKANMFMLGSTSDEQTIKGFFDNSLPGVWQTDQLFSPAFLQSMLAELEHLETAKASGLRIYVCHTCVCNVYLICRSRCDGLMG